jgi:cold shock CspA family protein
MVQLLRCTKSIQEVEKSKDIFVKVHDVRETVFTNQTVQFLTRSQS